MTQQLLKKITVRGIMGAKLPTHPAIEELIAKKNAKGTALCRIYGRADKAKPGATDKGPFVQFYGEFVGINLLTGERFDSGACILPGVIENTVYGALGQLDDKGHAQQTVEFAVEVAAKYDDTAATKYVFTATPLVEVKASEPMSKLLQAAGGLPAIEDKSSKKK